MRYGRPCEEGKDGDAAEGWRDEDSEARLDGLL